MSDGRVFVVGRASWELFAPVFRKALQSYGLNPEIVVCGFDRELRLWSGADEDFEADPPRAAVVFPGGARPVPAPAHGTPSRDRSRGGRHPGGGVPSRCHLLAVRAAPGGELDPVDRRGGVSRCPRRPERFRAGSRGGRDRRVQRPCAAPVPGGSGLVALRARARDPRAGRGRDLRRPDGPPGPHAALGARHEGPRRAARVALERGPGANEEGPGARLRQHALGRDRRRGWSGRHPPRRRRHRTSLHGVPAYRRIAREPGRARGPVLAQQPGGRRRGLCDAPGDGAPTGSYRCPPRRLGVEVGGARPARGDPRCGLGQLRVRGRQSRRARAGAIRASRGHDSGIPVRSRRSSGLRRGAGVAMVLQGQRHERGSRQDRAVSRAGAGRRRVEGVRQPRGVPAILAHGGRSSA